MKHYVWDKYKNARLIRTRGVSFEEVRYLVSEGKALMVDHHNPLKRPGQRMYVVEIRGYSYYVPFEETETEIILKIIIPSRKATKMYRKEKAHEEKKD